MRLSFRSATFIVTSALLWAACDQASPDRPAAAATNAPAAAAQPRPEFQRLIGSWERPDGGYILTLRTVNAAGLLDATYANPGPVHVERALAVSERGVTKVFVVLRDVNYPGCTYSLTYDEKADQLYGQYYQAHLRETFDVTFGRQPGPRP